MLWLILFLKIKGKRFQISRNKDTYIYIYIYIGDSVLHGSAMSLTNYSSVKGSRSLQGENGGILSKTSAHPVFARSSSLCAGGLSSPGSLTSTSHPPLHPNRISMSPSQRKYFLKLAQRFYLSFEMVCEAKEVFDRYRQLEKELSSSRPSSPNLTAEGIVSRRPTSVSRSSERRRTAEAVLGEISPSGQCQTATDTSNMEQGASSEKGQSPCSPPGNHMPARVSGMSSSSFSSLYPPTDALVEESLGVLGLQAFYLDLGIPKSALEVADVIQRMQSFPEELAMLQRKEAAERLQQELAAEAAAAASAMMDPEGVQNPGKGGSAPSSGRGKSKPRSQGGSEEKKISRKAGSTHGSSSDRSDRKSSGRSVETSPTASGHDVSGGTMPPFTPPPPLLKSTGGGGGSNADSTTAAPTLDAASKGLRFPLFLFLLQNRLSEEEGTPAHKDSEVLQAFHALDGDDDGVLSEEDIQRALIYLLQKEGVLANDRDLLELACMHPIELRTAITECDMNADGLVTAEDFLMVLRV